MADHFIRVSRDAGVLRLTLARPDVLNSFNHAMAVQLQDALAEAADDPDVRALLLTGEGRAFCAGQDLAEVPLDEGRRVDLGDVVRDNYNPIVRAVRTIEKPVVCAVNGVAAGAGANLALACDIVIAAESATFVQAFSRIGLIPDTGGTFVLPRLVGLARATAMVMLDERIPAPRAVELGLIYKAVPADALETEARTIVAQLATMPTRGLGLAKRALNEACSNTLDKQLALEERLQREAGATEDFAEGVAAFLAKRKPTFTGR